MGVQEPIVVIGAGIIGCAVAYALARENRPVWLMDRGEPGVLGASYGNVGHIACELVEPLPSPHLLFNFWRELYALDGPLDVPVRRLGSFLSWGRRFAAAAWRQRENTRYLAPLVVPARSVYEKWLTEIGRLDLLRRNGHYEFWLNEKAEAAARVRAQAVAHLNIRIEPVGTTLTETVRAAARAPGAAGLWFPDSGHVVDPLKVMRAFAHAARSRQAKILPGNVQTLRAAGESVEILTETETIRAHTVVVCAGAWAAPLLEPFGLHAPLEAAHGYHVEISGHAGLVDAPILYDNERLLVTPMAGRLRCSTYMEFSGVSSAPDARKPARLRAKVRRLGYDCDADGPSWRGPRPVLPDYLPGIGRAPGPARVFYAIGHQHIGLTLAPITGELMADLVAGRTPRLDVSAFDLRRFGTSRQ